MAKKPTLDELVDANINKTPRKRPRKRRRHSKRDHSDSLMVETIRKWVPHLVACDFDRFRAFELAFPSQAGASQKVIRNRTQALIKHPMFTDIMSAHLDTIDQKFGKSEQYVLDRMYRQAEANIFDYFSNDENGKLVVKDLKELPKWQQQNVKKIKVTNKIVDKGFERKMIDQSIELEIVDSFKPVLALGKNLGLFVERLEVDFGKHTADRLQDALERVQRKRLEQHGHQQPEDKPGPARTIN